jgi:CheY-like chemotaxis protein/anti-sigma regulatory factor (Ser/Thr protein kinase)
MKPKPQANTMTKILIVEDDRATRHLLTGLLKAADFSVSAARDGANALRHLKRQSFDLMLLDIWMPRMNGLELLARLRSEPVRPKVVVMTSDDTPETLLQAVREQAYQYVTKPVEPKALVELLRHVLTSAPASPPIEVISAKPSWVELLVPCERDAADRIQAFMAHLEADLAPELRDSVGVAFRELLLNAIEWGGQLDPNRKVRIAYLRANRMLLYRIADPGPGFSFKGLTHAAVGHPEGSPLNHMDPREEKGLRPGGFGIMISQAKVDELIYNEAQNEVVFVKYLD